MQVKKKNPEYTLNFFLKKQKSKQQQQKTQTNKTPQTKKKQPHKLNPLHAKPTKQNHNLQIGNLKLSLCQSESHWTLVTHLWSNVFLCF